jgi:hypothetical protein
MPLSSPASCSIGIAMEGSNDASAACNQYIEVKCTRVVCGLYQLDSFTSASQVRDRDCKVKGMQKHKENVLDLLLDLQVNSPGGQLRESCPGYHQLGAPHEHVQDDEHPKSDFCFPPQRMVAYWHLMPTRHTPLEEFHHPPEIRST